VANLIYAFWGIALLAILVLGGIVLWTQRGARRGTNPVARPGSSPVEIAGSGESAFRAVTDTLLLYYEEEGIRSTLRGDVVLRIPGAAWEREWQEDLVRLEVSTVDPNAVAMPKQWGQAKALAAYALRAYRMTEIGTDIAVEQFAAPIDIFLLTEGSGEGLRFGIERDRNWMLAPPSTLSLDALAGVDLPSGRSWVAASISGPYRICLARLAREGAGRV
jgi:hypothetical protein